MPVRQIDERVVADIWERQAFDPAALDALGLRVLFRGLPSDAGGPDYQEAILERDGRTVTSGDVEFHVSASDWYAHGHHRDSHYELVVLHVVWQGEEETRTRSGRVVPTLVLQPCLEPDRPLQMPLQQLSHPCVRAYAALSPPQLEAAVRAAGLARYRERAAGFAADLTHVSADQLMYTAMLEALGYASNRPVFRSLAEAAPYAWIISVPPGDRQRALLAAAGLGPADSHAPPARLRPDVWRLSRLRPANHPAVRLAGMAVLLSRLGPSLTESLYCAVIDRKAGAAEAIDLLTARDSKRSLIGAGRATEMLASAVLPILTACTSGDDRVEALYLHLPAPPKNRWTRKMLALLDEAGHAPRVRRAPEHQGLHRLYHTHCRYERRTGCPVCGPPQRATDTVDR
jgi:hypothetical protein